MTQKSIAFISSHMKVWNGEIIKQQLEIQENEWTGNGKEILI